MLIDEDKIEICKTLDNCWFFNLTKQNMCQEIFQTFNRVWNRIHASSSEKQEIRSDSAKFKKLLNEILGSDEFANFIFLPSLTELSEIYPLIHNDSVVSECNGSPFSLTNADELPLEKSEQATSEHREFNDYLFRVREKTNNKNKQKFINKLARLLYLVRSNIAHGSKLQYQGSERNEHICSLVYQVLLDLSNIILKNGLYKIAAYGELKQSGMLYTPLVINNNGMYLTDAQVVGGTIDTNNTVLYNPRLEFERTNVQIIEFGKQENIHEIDLVECMQRSLTPFYFQNKLEGFAWIYQRFVQVENYDGPKSSIDIGIAIQDCCMTFLHTLISLRQIYLMRVKKYGEQRKMFFGKLTIEIGQVINYETNKDYSNLVHPLAPNIISLINEIGRSFNLIFNKNDSNYPFSHIIDAAIYEDFVLEKKFYNKFSAKAEDDITQKIYLKLVNEIIEFIADWICKQCGDEDVKLWDELNVR